MNEQKLEYYKLIYFNIRKPSISKKIQEFKAILKIMVLSESIFAVFLAKFIDIVRMIYLLKLIINLNLELISNTTNQSQLLK
ncbi:unnamed protein product [Paramecium octaurelia]|uniref:Uncharacterized protein n=1 Tax=Paramecium octaurelia TaxID=43137 RepID=A0A8S1UXN4_PAROT|nr:unnamed protein product [Paramecium octaurelia]